MNNCAWTFSNDVKGDKSLLICAQNWNQIVLSFRVKQLGYTYKVLVCEMITITIIY